MAKPTGQKDKGVFGVLRRGAGLFGRAYRVLVTAGRWFVVAFWIAAAILVSTQVPHGDDGNGDFGALLPPDSPVIQVEENILEQFRVPVLSGTSVVLHQDGGLSRLARADSYLWAASTTQAAIDDPPPPGPGSIVAAIPIPTGIPSTTVTYLFLSEGTGISPSSFIARDYAAHFNNQPEARTYVTGFVPAQAAQSRYLATRIGLFEICSLILIITVVALAFRSLAAPLAVVGVAGVGYLVYFPLLSYIAASLGFSVPNQLEPVLLALLLGVVTDYCVLFFSDFRDELEAGAGKYDGVRGALRSQAGIVAVAGLTVAGGTIALLAAPFELFRSLGPALVTTVAVGVLLCLTLTPALMSILGWRLFTVLPVRGSRAPKRLPMKTEDDGAPKAGLALRLITRKVPAAVVAGIVLVLLGAASLPLAHAKLDLSFTAGLPAQDEVAEGAELLGDAGLRGITAPTEIMVQERGIISKRSELVKMQDIIAAQPGVARVLGPSDWPLDSPRGIVLSENGDAARYIVIFDSDPLAARAIDDALTLSNRLPGLARDAGLEESLVSITGQSLIAAEVSDLTRESLFITLVVAIVIEMFILTLYLRAPITALALLICSALSVAATLGLTTLLFQDVLGNQGLTFYAPFSAAVLLIALGSDYNVFSLGAIWGHRKGRTLRGALLVSVPRSARAITTAGAILAATFAMVAIIPLSTFRQIAFAMAVGLLIDTFVLRPVLTPALLTLLGRFAGWPGKLFLPRGEAEQAPTPGQPRSFERAYSGGEDG